MRSNSRAAALACSAAASFAYLLLPKAAPSLPEIVLKGIPVTLLAIVALQAERWLLALALLCSACGDVLLACGSSFFLPGLAAFLCAHLVYIAVFLRRRATRAKPAFPCFLLFYGVAFGAWLSPSLGALRLPVFCYIAAIIAMASAAYAAGYRSRWVPLGAILFLISDSLLGAARFRTPLPLGGILVWITYYAGQCAITLGVVNEKAEDRRQK